MASINNVFGVNEPNNGGQNMWRHIWRLSRCLKGAGWKHLASGDGTTKTVSDDPALDEWGDGVSTGNTGAAASIAAPALGRAIITGLSGMAAEDKGRFLRLSGAATGDNNNDHQIEEVLSATSVAIDARRAAFTPASDANNGSISWDVIDANGDDYLASEGNALASVNAWWLASGPSYIKVPITSAPTGTFRRGENVVQAVTGAEGEIRGYVFNGTAGVLCIAPRKRGSGGDPYGWATGNAITGDDSGASVSQDGAANAYTQQIMLWKGNDQEHGTIYIQAIDKVGETADDFETLASAAGCTATNGPGMGGTGNSFPALAYVIAGDGSSAAEVNWNGSNSTQNIGNGQIIATDAIEEEGYSANGSWGCFSAGQSSLTGHAGYFHLLCDDGEPVDFHPYVSHCAPSQISIASSLTQARVDTGQISAGGFTTGDRFTTEMMDNTIGTSQSPIRSWVNRGWGQTEVPDTFICPSIVVDVEYQTSTSPITERVAARYASDNNVNRSKLREPLRFWSVRFYVTNKGVARNMSLITGGQRLDTYDNGKHLQLSSVNGAFVWTPWDEATVPISS